MRGSGALCGLSEGDMLMEDTFLIGNEIIEYALAEASADMDHETIMNLVEAI